MTDRPLGRLSAAQGVIASLFASALFAGMFYLSGSVQVPPEVVFGWRVLITLALYSLMLAHPAARRALGAYWANLTSTRVRPLVLVVLAALIGLQLWLFAWAPFHGHALDASLGFLLLPLALALGGRFVLRESLSRVQWLAVFIAAVAVGVKLVLTPQLSWVTLAICVGYPIYFILRRKSGLDNAAAFGVEMAVLMPAAAIMAAITQLDRTLSVGEMSTIAAIGLAGAAAMAAYLLASRLLALPLFGLLSYVEPILLVVAALLLGERITGPDVVVYSLLAFALLGLGVEGLLRSRRQRLTSTQGASVEPRASG